MQRKTFRPTKIAAHVAASTRAASASASMSGRRISAWPTRRPTSSVAHPKASRSSRAKAATSAAMSDPRPSASRSQAAAMRAVIGAMPSRVATGGRSSSMSGRCRPSLSSGRT